MGSAQISTGFTIRAAGRSTPFLFLASVLARSEIARAQCLEATSEKIICTVHAHPTMHEAVREAALASEGRVVNS
ncbi:MAG: hypothetical protein JNM86_08620 [Phycisphaerae bacterium]|nr:hypothetical protein [Phycisphaerae bacterium]